MAKRRKRDVREAQTRRETRQGVEVAEARKKGKPRSVGTIIVGDVVVENRRVMDEIRINFLRLCPSRWRRGTVIQGRNRRGQARFYVVFRVRGDLILLQTPDGVRLQNWFSAEDMAARGFRPVAYLKD